MTEKKKIELATYKTKGKTKKKEPETLPLNANPATRRPPAYLNAEQKRLYTFYATRLIELGILADIDTWTLGSFCKAFTEWKSISKLIDVYEVDPEDFRSLDNYKKLSIEQNRWYKQMRELGSDMGLNITSRCRLKMPGDDSEQENKFLQFIE